MYNHFPVFGCGIWSCTRRIRVCWGTLRSGVRWTSNCFCAKGHTISYGQDNNGKINRGVVHECAPGTDCRVHISVVDVLEFYPAKAACG